MPRPRGMRRLVDDGYKIRQNIKTLTDELDDIKVQLKKYAKDNGDGETTLIIEGQSASALVYHSSTTDVDPSAAWRIMKPNMRKFLQVVKIKMRELRASITTDDAEKVISKVEDPYSRIKFASKGAKFTPKLLGRLTRKIQI